MSRRLRTLLFVAGAGGLAVLLMLSYLDLPDFGTVRHPYGGRAVHAALTVRNTANVVSSVNFDQRAMDTLGEEFIFFASVIGAVVLLRPGRRERNTVARALDEQVGPAQILDATRLLGYVVLPVTVVIGWYVVVHGHVSPGGGFQGGVVLATALHLLYLTCDYHALLSLRPIAPYQQAEVIGAGAFVLIGLAALASGATFLANVLPTGHTLASLASAGTVPILNTTVGIEIAAGVVLLLARFFEQDLMIGPGGSSGRPGRARGVGR